jgi:uncharacterized protein (TIGR03118 family)
MALDSKQPPSFGIRADRRLTLFVLIGVSLAGVISVQGAGNPSGYVETDLVVNQKVNGVPTLTDANGIVHVAKFWDPNLLNAWGIASSATSFFWISDNGAGTSTLYNTPGMPQTLAVSIPSPDNPLGTGGAPTGVVFNIASAQQAFTISGVNSSGLPAKAPALFLFATEDGTILGWNPAINPPGFDPAKAGKYAIIAVDNSAKPTADAGAVYKGLAIATDSTGASHLYVTNFRAGNVEVYDSGFKPVISPTAFVDRGLPAGYAPFGIQTITIGETTKLFVTYAVQDDQKHDDVAGESHGIVDTFDLAGSSGSFQRFSQHGQLNSPWGVVLAPTGFGEFGSAVWIGNFGNGHIDAYEPESGRFLGKVRDPHGQTLVIDGLWGLRVGNGGNGGDAGTVYFTAGPNGEKDGLFGSLTANK